MRSQIHHHANADRNGKRGDAPNLNLICPQATTVSMAQPSMATIFYANDISGCCVCVCLCFDGLLARSPHLHFLLDEIFQKALQHLFYLPRLSRWYVSSILVYFICFFVVCFLVGHYIVLQRCAIYGGIGLARPSKMSGIKSLKPPRSRSRTTTPSRLLDM